MWYGEIGSVLKKERSYVMKIHFVSTKLYNIFVSTVYILTYRHGLANALPKLNRLLKWTAQKTIWYLVPS